MGRKYNANQLMDHYRSAMNLILGEDYSVKSSVLRMRMLSDGLDEVTADSMVHALIEENSIAISSVR